MDSALDPGIDIGAQIRQFVDAVTKHRGTKRADLTCDTLSQTCFKSSGSYTLPDGSTRNFSPGNEPYPGTSLWETPTRRDTATPLWLPAATTTPGFVQTYMTLSSTTSAFDAGATTLPFVVKTDTNFPSITESISDAAVTSVRTSTETVESQTARSNRTTVAITSSITSEPTEKSPASGAVATSTTRSDGHEVELGNGVWMVLAAGCAIVVCQFVTLGQLVLVHEWIPEVVF